MGGMNSSLFPAATSAMLLTIFLQPPHMAMTTARKPRTTVPSMKTNRTSLTLATLALAGLSFAHGEKIATPDADRPVVQLAILLDNSGSMSGLIGQAKSQLWAMVNEFISAKQEGKAPRVQVALFEYGMSSHGEKGYIEKLSPLTDDLDKLSEQLFSISQKDSGGEEYCGWVIKDALEQLEWDKSPKTYKAIFIAGNEPFTQGKVGYRDVCKSAISKGIIVNTIHCGSEQEGIEGKWKDGAALADGRYLIIDHNAALVSIAAPQDKEIAELNSQLNTTYLAYGARGAEGKARQEAQDKNTASAPAPAAALAARTVSKSSAVYSNSSWDLLDRAKEKDFDITKLKADELPEEMRKLSPEERTALLEKKKTERATLQKQLGDLAVAREKFVAENSKAPDASLGKAVTTAIREQAAKKGVKFEK